MRALLAASCVALAACSQMPVHEQEMDHHTPEHINVGEPMSYPFSSAVRSGPFLFMSGQIGSRMVDGAPVVVEGGIQPETRQALENIKEIVEYAGGSMASIVKCTVMVADISEWPAMNEIYATYFPGPKPARAAFGANGLALNARVEIDCTAVIE